MAISGKNVMDDPNALGNLLKSVRAASKDLTAENEQKNRFLRFVYSGPIFTSGNWDNEKLKPVDDSNGSLMILLHLKFRDRDTTFYLNVSHPRLLDFINKQNFEILDIKTGSSPIPKGAFYVFAGDSFIAIQDYENMMKEYEAIPHQKYVVSAEIVIDETQKDVFVSEALFVMRDQDGNTVSDFRYYLAQRNGRYGLTIVRD